jgi:hypothetical protein
VSGGGRGGVVDGVGRCFCVAITFLFNALLFLDDHFACQEGIMIVTRES